MLRVNDVHVELVQIYIDALDGEAALVIGVDLELDSEVGTFASQIHISKTVVLMKE